MRSIALLSLAFVGVLWAVGEPTGGGCRDTGTSSCLRDGQVLVSVRWREPGDEQTRPLTAGPRLSSELATFVTGDGVRPEVFVGISGGGEGIEIEPQVTAWRDGELWVRIEDSETLHSRTYYSPALGRQRVVERQAWLEHCALVDCGDESTTGRRVVAFDP